MKKIIKEIDTLKLIINEEKNLARFGDGEGKILYGGNAPGQIYTPDLQEKLKVILRRDIPNLLVGIPWADLNWDEKQYNRQYIDLHTRWYNKISKFFGKKEPYCSQWVTRPDTALFMNDDSNYDLWKQVWQNKDIVVVSGTRKKAGYDSDFFDNAKSKEYYEVLPRDTYTPEISKKLIEYVQTKSKDTMFILECGPAATVWAYFINVLNYRVIDLGHLGMFYRRKKERENKNG